MFSEDEFVPVPIRPLPSALLKRAHNPNRSAAPAKKRPAPPPRVSNSEGKKPKARTLREMQIEKFVAHLRKKMNEIRLSVLEREAEENEAYKKKNELPKWRNARGQETKSSLLNLGNLLSERDFITYLEFCEITHHESQLSVLGGTGNNHSALVRNSNKETSTFHYVYEHLEEMLEPLCFGTSLFAARPEQLLAVAEKLVKYPMDITCHVRQLNDTYDERANPVTREAGVLPQIDLINYATGNGKTWAAILASMTEVVNPKLWAHLKSNWRETMKGNSVVPHLGLSVRPCLDDDRLARVVLALIPEGTLFEQWSKTAHAVQAAMRDQLGMDFIIWTGIHKLKRKSKLDPIGKEGTLKDAHELCTSSNKAMLWLVPAKTDSAKKTLRATDSNHLHVPIRIYDEMSCRTEPKSAGRESWVMKNVIVQATVERLERATSNQKAHPLRKALSGYNLDPQNSDHAAKFHLLTAPDWLRWLVSIGMQSLMPAGIRKITMKVRMQSLSAIVNKSDMNITSLDELLNAMLNSQNANYTEMTATQRKEFLGRCRGILDAAAQEQDTTIHSRLAAAIHDLKSVEEALPPPAQPTAPGVPIALHLINANRDIERERKILACMIRVLTKLSEAVCVDPPPECPISMEEIPPEKVAIFACCTNLFNVDFTSMIGNKCPMCRASISNRIIKATTAIGALVEETKTPEADATGPSTVNEHELVGDEANLVERLSDVADKYKFTMASKAVAKTVKEFLRFKPRGARILLAYSCYDDHHTNDPTHRTRTLLKQDVPELDSVMAIHKKHPEVIERFTNTDDQNRVLIINTSDGSASLEGLDLWNTDLVIIDRLGGSFRLTPSKIVQTVGRAMRPQLKGADAEFNSISDGPSDFPAKMIVMLERHVARDVPHT